MKRKKQSPCQKCKGLCCRYFTVSMESPKTREDFDDLRWYLAHGGVAVYVDDGNWYVQILSRCRHLTPENRCAIYAHRPRICRTYRAGGCDLSGGDYEYELCFRSDAEMDAYIRVRFDNRKAEKAWTKTVK